MSEQRYFWIDAFQKDWWNIEDECENESGLIDESTPVPVASRTGGRLSVESSLPEIRW